MLRNTETVLGREQVGPLLPGARPASGNVVSRGRSGQSPGAGIPGLAPSFPCSRGPPCLGRTNVGLGAAGRPTGTVPWLKTEAPLPPPRLCSAPRRRNGSPAPCGDVVSPRRGAADRATAVFAWPRVHGRPLPVKPGELGARPEAPLCSAGTPVSGG